MNPFQLKDGEKFAAIAVTIPFWEVELPTTFCSRYKLLTVAEDWVESHWKEWLGTSLNWTSERNLLYIVASAPSNDTVLNHEHEQLTIEVRRVLESLTIVGAIPVAGTHTRLLTGHCSGKRCILRSLRDGNSYVTVNFGDPTYTVVNHERFRRAEKVLVGIERLRQDTTIFQRLRRGIRSAVDALTCRQIDERIFYVARAIEAIQGGDRTHGKAKFVENCKKLTGPTCHSIFETLYEVRSNFAHAREVSALLADGETYEELDLRLEESAYKSEMIVFELFSAILEDPALLSRFESDASSRLFWASSDVPSITWEETIRRRSAELS